MKNMFFALGISICCLANAQVQTEFYANGNKKSEGEYAASTVGVNLVVASDGSTRQAPTQLKNGTWNFWYETGLKSAEETYTDGATTGIWKSWYPDGAKSAEINYVSGKATFWHPNGKKQSEGEMLQNRTFNGKWIGWTEGGVKSYEGNYVMGKKEGEWYWYDESGKLTSKQIYANDVLIDTQK